MVSAWIPAAQLVGGFLVAVCAIVAVIVINLQDEGRGRVLGVLGAVLVVMSIVLGAVNRSVGSVYGTDTLTFDVGLVISGGCGAAGLVSMALAVVSVGRGRTLGGARR